MDGFVRLFVDYCQYQVHALPGGDGLRIYTVGDGLVHVGGPSHCTGFAATHTGWIEMRAVVTDHAPDRVEDGWEAVSETTLWCPGGRFSVIGLMGGSAEELTDVAVSRRGLIRVRLHARNRLHETVRTEDDPPEQHLIHVWPVTEETGHRSLDSDDTRTDFEQRPAEAAEWAMLSLVPRPRGWPRSEPDPDEDDTGLARVDVVRRRNMSPASARSLLAGAGRVMSAGDLEVTLQTIADGPDTRTLTWEWATAAAPIFPEPLTTLPDDEPSTVRLRIDEGGELTLRHEGVLGRHAVALGLIWDHLLDLPDGMPPRWETTLRAQAAEATERAGKARRRREEQESAQWGGTAPTERLRALPGQARSLALLDRPLLDRLAATPADRLREVACWAARRAMSVAGLDRVGWIADGLATVEAGGSLPAFFTDNHGADAFRRLLDDPAVPQAVITIPGGPSNFLQQAAAFPALLALGAEDPLAAAVDAIYNAAIAHGDQHARFLAELGD